MNSVIYSKIKKCCPQNPEIVNRLLVTAFVVEKKWNLNESSFLRRYIIEDKSSKEYALLEVLLNILKRNGCTFSLEELIELFECVLSPQEKVDNGAVYTPKPIREYIVQTLLKTRNNIAQLKIADISCGCGAFLLTTALLIHQKTQKNYYNIIQDNLYGFDIADYALERAKILLSFLLLEEGELGSPTFNLYQQDSLLGNFKSYCEEGFDLIVGNPPYVCARKLTQTTRNRLKQWEVCRKGLPDLYIPFFQIALENLSNTGEVGFISVNSFFKSLNGVALREYFCRHRTSLKVIDFGYKSVFRDKCVYTCIIFLSNQTADSVEYTLIDPNNLFGPKNFQKVEYDLLSARNGWNLNENALCSHLESLGNSIGQICESRHGIATLKNDVFVFKPIKDDGQFFWFEKGCTQIRVEKLICRTIVNSNKINQETTLDDLKEKIIFPYEYGTDGTVSLLKEKDLKKKFKYAYQYLKQNLDLLLKRDKGKTDHYPDWFAYGRTQSLNVHGNKLFFPKFSYKQPNCLFSKDDQLLFYNGQAFISEDANLLLFIKKILESIVFGLYIQLTSKPYSSGYYSLNGNYIKHFTIPDSVMAQKDWVISHEQDEVDIYLINAYSEGLVEKDRKRFVSLLNQYRDS